MNERNPPSNRIQSPEGDTTVRDSIRRIFFRFRLYIGLAVTAVGIAILEPTPFFDIHYVFLHTLAVGIILAGLALRAWGAGSAGRHTRTATIEAPRLATSGPFAYNRNPIYTGSICLGVGMATLIGDPLAFVLTGIAFAILYFSIVPAEEKFLTERFGDEYRQYRASVPRFFPRLRPWSGRIHRPFQWRAIRGELSIAGLLVGIYLVLLGEEYLEKTGWF